MQNIFDAKDRESILQRLERLPSGATRQWGKMDAAQMLTHCAVGLEMGVGDRPMKQKLIGKILAPFFRSAILGDKPFGRNSPTDPAFVITDQRNFEAEKTRVVDLINRFCERGPDHAAQQTHAFLGRLTGAEWGRMQYKHLDHHLRQFGA